METWCEVDYRKDDHVSVNEGEDGTTFIVTLKLYLRVVQKDYTGSHDLHSTLEKWCSNWSTTHINNEFNPIYSVKWVKWLEPTVIQMEIEKPEHYTRGTYTLKEMYDSFRYDCLEDIFYEGGAGDSVWLVPTSFQDQV